MEEILLLLISNPEEALTLLTESQIDPKLIEDIRKEYYDLDRSLRTTQVDSVQQDKTVKTENGEKIVPTVKIPIPFQNKIVGTATAFEVGGGISLDPNENNDLADEILRLWRANRIESKVKRMKTLQKSELQCALLFYIEDLGSKNVFNRWLNIKQNKEIKCRLLENENGTMAPYFDAFGDMKAFTWQFLVEQNGSEVKHAYVYTEEDVYHFDTSSGTMQPSAEDPKLAHGFGKIPIVYVTQDDVEWEIAKPMIDRIEVSMSKLGGANDYTAYPMLKLYGEVKGAPSKDDAGKVFNLPMEKDDDGKWQHGDVEFLEHSQKPESTKLELDMLEKYIYSVTSTPDISFNNMKGLGGVSGITIRLMFLDAIIKAKMNEGENSTIIDRIVNVLIAGTVTTTNTGQKNAAKETYFDISFPSILPQDLVETVDTLSKAYESGIMSRETAVRELSATDDSEEELAKIEDAAKTATEPPAEPATEE